MTLITPRYVVCTAFRVFFFKNTLPHLTHIHMKIPWHLALCLTCTEQLPFVTMGHLPTEPSREKESKRSKLSVWSHQCTPTSQSAKHEENVRESMGITSVGCKVEAENRVSDRQWTKQRGRLTRKWQVADLLHVVDRLLRSPSSTQDHQFLDKHNVGAILSLWLGGLGGPWLFPAIHRAMWQKGCRRLLPDGSSSIVDVHFVPGTFSLESMSCLFEWDGWECIFHEIYSWWLVWGESIDKSRFCLTIIIIVLYCFVINFLSARAVHQCNISQQISQTDIEADSPWYSSPSIGSSSLRGLQWLLV